MGHYAYQVKISLSIFEDPSEVVDRLRAAVGVVIDPFGGEGFHPPFPSSG